jgi:hypothetical protein
VNLRVVGGGEEGVEDFMTPREGLKREKREKSQMKMG